MTQVTLAGTPIQIIGELPAVGTPATNFSLVAADLGEITLESRRRTVLNIFPSVDTGICAASVRHFNEVAASLPNTTVLCVSKDLPFAGGRFCAAEGLTHVKTASAFRSTFGEDYGVTIMEGPLMGLLARAVVVVAPDGTISYGQLVPEIKQEPDYEAVLAHLQACAS